MLHARDGLMVSAFVESDPLTPEKAGDSAMIERLAALLKEVHGAGAAVRGHFQYFSPFVVARTYIGLAKAEGLAMPTRDVDRLLDRVGALERRVAAFEPTFCHNDLMPGNLLDAVWADLAHRLGVRRVRAPAVRPGRAGEQLRVLR